MIDFDDLFSGETKNVNDIKKYKILLYFEEKLISTTITQIDSEMLGTRGEASLMNFKVVWCII